MATTISRNAIIDAYVSLLQDSSKTVLAALDNARIQYCEKDPTTISKVTHPTEIWVAPLSDIITARTIAKEGHAFKSYIVVFVKGQKGVTDKRAVVTLCEEIELELLENRALPGGVGNIRDEPMLMDFASFFTQKSTLNYGWVEVTADKTTMI